MNSEKLKKLAEISAQNTTIPEDIRKFVLTQLNKNDLKIFLRHYKNALRNKRIYVTSSDILSKEEQTNLKKSYPEKDLVFTTDSAMGAGIKIQDNDTIFDLTFKKHVTDIIRELTHDF